MTQNEFDALKRAVEASRKKDLDEMTAELSHAGVLVSQFVWRENLLALFDPAPADEAWVRAVLPVTNRNSNRKPGLQSGRYQGPHGWVSWEGTGDTFCVWLNGLLLRVGDHEDPVSRGEFRRICWAVGVPLKEGV